VNGRLAVTLLGPLLALAVVAASDPPSAAGPSPEVRREVEELLGSIHGPVAPETFRALGPGVDQVLADVARADGMPSRRIRALEALAALGGPRAEATHRAVAASAAPSAVRRGAIRGLGRLSGAGAPRALAPFLERDRDPAVRAAAAEALAEAAPAACGRIRARARAEGNDARFQRALDACRTGAGGAR
jgi:HEAT repeat protein